MNDLYKDILKARQIPAPSETKVNFKRTKASERDTRDKKINYHNIRQPTNVKLYNDMLGNAENQSENAKGLLDSEIKFDEHAVSCSIQAVCGRMNHSAESIKMFVTALQNKKNSSADNSRDSEEQENKTEEKEETKNEEDVLKQSGLLRNGAIKGLLKQKIISVNDIQVPDAKAGQTLSDKENLYSYPSFVPNPEEPDVYVRAPQAYNNLDKTFQDIDFTVTHVGKKHVISPRQFYLDVDDDYFTFTKGKGN